MPKSARPRKRRSHQTRARAVIGWHMSQYMRVPADLDTVDDLELLVRLSFDRLKTEPTEKDLAIMMVVFNSAMIGIAQKNFTFNDEQKEGIEQCYRELAGIVDRYHKTGRIALTGNLIRHYPAVLDMHLLMLESLSRADVLELLRLGKMATEGKIK